VIQHIISTIIGHHWAMRPEVLFQMLQLVERKSTGGRVTDDELRMIAKDRDRAHADLVIDIEDDIEPDRDMGFQRVGSVAVVAIGGVITKYASSVGGISQPKGTSTESIGASVRAAQRDDRIRSILLHIDSPGGSIAGVETLASELARMRGDNGSKPIVTFASDCMCSAAYWIGSQAGRVYASEMAKIGRASCRERV